MRKNPEDSRRRILFHADVVVDEFCIWEIFPVDRPAHMEQS